MSWVLDETFIKDKNGRILFIVKDAKPNEIVECQAAPVLAEMLQRILKLLGPLRQ